MNSGELSRIQPDTAIQLNAALVTQQIETAQNTVLSDTNLSAQAKAAKLQKIQDVSKAIAKNKYTEASKLADDLNAIDSNLTDSIQIRTVVNDNGEEQVIAISQDFLDATEKQRNNLNAKNANNVRGKMFKQVKEILDLRKDDATSPTTDSTQPTNSKNQQNPTDNPQQPLNPDTTNEDEDDADTNVYDD